MQAMLAEEASAPSLRQHVALLHCNLTLERDEPLAIHFPVTLVAAEPSPAEQLCRGEAAARFLSNSSISSNSSVIVKGVVAKSGIHIDTKAFIDMSYRHGVLQLNDALTASSLLEMPDGVNSNSQPSPSSKPKPGALRLQNLLLIGLAQGPEADGAVEMLSPHVWTILLWGISR
jgi:hypothetical protein